MDIPENIKLLLSKEDRTDNEKSEVYEYVINLKGVKDFFERLSISDEDSISEVCNMFRYEYQPKGEITMKQFSKSNLKFYYLIKGKVTVLRADGVQEKYLLDSELQAMVHFRKKNARNIARNKELLQQFEVFDRVATQRLKLEGNYFSFSSDASQLGSPNKSPLRSPLKRPRESVFQRTKKNFNKRQTMNNAMISKTMKVKKAEEFWDFKKAEVSNDNVRPLVAELSKMLDKYREQFPLEMQEDEEECDPIMYAILKFFLGKNLVDLSSGAMFGERALMSNDGRTASIITKYNCGYLTLGKDEYTTYILKHQREVREMKYRYIRKVIPMLDTFSSEKVWQLQYALKEKRYTEGSIICKEGEPGNRPFIIKSGQCVVYRSNDPSTIKEWLDSSASPTSPENLEQIEKENQIFKSFVATCKNYRQKSTKICFVGENELCCLESLFSDTDTCLFTIQAISHKVQVLYLTEDVDHRFLSPQILKNLYSTLMVQVSRRVKYIKLRTDILKLAKEDLNAKKSAGSENIGRLARYKKVRHALERTVLIGGESKDMGIEGVKRGKRHWKEVLISDKDHIRKINKLSETLKRVKRGDFKYLGLDVDRNKNLKEEEMWKYTKLTGHQKFIDRYVRQKRMRDGDDPVFVTLKALSKQMTPNTSVIGSRIRGRTKSDAYNIDFFENPKNEVFVSKHTDREDNMRKSKRTVSSSGHNFTVMRNTQNTRKTIKGSHNHSKSNIRQMINSKDYFILKRNNRGKKKKKLPRLITHSQSNSNIGVKKTKLMNRKGRTTVKSCFSMKQLMPLNDSPAKGGLITRKSNKKN